MTQLQLSQLFQKIRQFHTLYGDSILKPIYGAGRIDKPETCLVFMNPTAKNIAAHEGWLGIKAPWLGTKNVWRLLFRLGFLTDFYYLKEIEARKPTDWSAEFAEDLYTHVAESSLYITNIAKCTLLTARNPKHLVFQDSLAIMFEELRLVRPQRVIAMGNLVSSTLLQRPISVSKYMNGEHEDLSVTSDLSINVYPIYYPVGQGIPNMPKAIAQISKIKGI